ncbi:MAG: hypothetical protein B6I19_06060 [Bacteroidetes bacterium 4572_114]|nr:MAG: hypothetical protein B6I19_06060 [Bacteroidetes bacterium 4572_114]
MKTKGVFWGVLLVAIGTLFVLRNFGLFYFRWYDLRHLWPVILVILGISLLPIKGAVRIILSFIIVIIAMVYITTKPMYHDHDNLGSGWGWHWDGEKHSDWDDERWTDQFLYENYNDGVENAVLELDAVAGEFSISETDDYLLKFERQGNLGKYYLEADNVGSAVVLKLSMEEGKIRSSGFNNEAEISLNPVPVWDINMDAGAAKIEFDLSPFKIDRVDIDGGASSIWLKFGDKIDKTDLQIDTGASAITIEVPEGVGCELKTNTVLSSKSFDGFDKIESGLYQTPGFNSNDKQIFIGIDAAVTSLRVERY